MARRAALPFDPIAEAACQWRSHGWDDAADGMAAVTSVMRVHQLLLSRVDDALKPFGLSFARYEVLMLLCFSRAGALPLGRIGDLLQVHAASVTNAVDRLETSGLVTRVRNPADGRGWFASVTAEGRALARRATRVLNARVFTDLGLSPAEMGALFSLLRKLRETAGDFDAALGSGGVSRPVEPVPTGGLP